MWIIARRAGQCCAMWNARNVLFNGRIILVCGNYIWIDGTGSDSVLEQGVPLRAGMPGRFTLPYEIETV